jgi:hypothetical protein
VCELTKETAFRLVANPLMQSQSGFILTRSPSSLMHFTMYVQIYELTCLDWVTNLSCKMNDLVGFIVALVALRVSLL